ncbi:MAG: thioredoxin [Acidianus infernus]|nr:thioredoxin [Acidianus infernus]
MSEIESLIKEIAEKLQKREESIKSPKYEPESVSEDNFDEILSKNKVVVIDCWADWCAPCHLYEPIFKKIAEKYKDKAFFGRLNVDENQKLADKYNVLNIPTTLIFVDGQLKDSLVGAVDENTLEDTIKKYIP